VVVFVNLIVDLLYPLIDPRVRVGGSKGDSTTASRGLRRELRAQRRQATEPAG